ncbi:MAG TPA: glycosyltransferase [Actinomycetota bacterium]|nr:glycosyltransferase [Actinomycetota bacterium]
MNVCTVTVRRRLPYARVLADSLLEQHPDARFTVLILDDPFEEQWQDGLEMLSPSDIGISGPELHNLAMLLSLDDLHLACIPRLLKFLLATSGEPHVYLADDVRVYGRLDSLRRMIEERGLVLTPRAPLSLPADGLTPDQAQLLSIGLYNSGLIGVAPTAGEFLDWWIEAMRTESRRNLPTAAVLESSAQPKAIPFTRILDMGSRFQHGSFSASNSFVSFWNVWAQELAGGGERWTAGGEPLTLFRFEGFNPEVPHLLSVDQGPRPRVLLSQRLDVAEITLDYNARLANAGFEEASKIPAGFEKLPGGLTVDARMRFVYRKAYKAYLDGLAPQPPDPFDRFDSEAFVDWLNAPDEEGFAPAVPRYLLALYEERLDLKAAYPGLAHADAGRYLDWVMRYGAKEAQIPPELCRFDQSIRRSPADDRAEAASPGTLRRRELRPLGLNVAGYFKAESGVGEMARLVLSGVEQSGLPYSTFAYQARYSRQNHSFTPTGEKFAYGVNLFCVNADELYPLVRDTGPKILDNRYNVALWWWELDEFPEIPADTEKLFDEVWVGTDHVARAVRARTGKPVHRIPVPIRHMDTPPDREGLGLPDNFLFLFTFDFLSAFSRKNPLGVIEAFSRAFKPGEGPVLVIKSINGTAEVAALEVLRLAAAGRSDIRIIDGYLPPERKDALIASCDCYVSLHRAEGYGLGMAEAVALGKPVIATNYSGNLEFLNDDNSYLVGYEMSSVPSATGPYSEGAAWADPDIDEAAAAMRRVFENRQEAEAKGRLARQQARTLHTPERTAQFLRRRLAEIQQIQLQRQKEEFRKQLKAGLTRRLSFQRAPGSPQK